MRAFFRPSPTGFAAAIFAVASLAVPAAAQNQPPGPPTKEQFQHYADAGRQALGVKLSDMKGGLKLTADQQKLWPPFEDAVRNGFQMRMDYMQKSLDTMRSGGRPSPVDRLEAMSDSMSRGAAALKAIGDAAKPLYASLNEAQKQAFETLGQALLFPQRAAGGTPGAGKRD
jgi:Spy/CpxP family protein refolding chaperone